MGSNGKLGDELLIQDRPLPVIVSDLLFFIKE